MFVSDDTTRRHDPPGPQPWQLTLEQVRRALVDEPWNRSYRRLHLELTGEEFRAPERDRRGDMPWSASTTP